MDAEVYPEDRVAGFIREFLIPVKIHVKEHPEQFQRFGAQWTPTIQILDPEGTKRFQFEGFLPADDFLAQLKLGLAQLAFAKEEWQEAERRFRDIVETFPNTDAAPEALYWAGVSRYKRTGDAAALGNTASAFKQRYINSTWAKKASVWAA